MKSQAYLKSENKQSLPASTKETDKSVRSNLGNHAALSRRGNFNFSDIKVNHVDRRASSPLQIQPKLKVNQPGDVYEREADKIADQVMRMPINLYGGNLNLKSSVSPLQRKCSHCEEEEKSNHKKTSESTSDHLIQKKCAKCQEEEEEVKRKESDTTSQPPVSEAVDQTLGSDGHPMNESTRTFMEQRFGFDFSKIRIHDDSLAHQSSKDINALAYTHGNHVVFGAGQYQPDTLSGKQLLAHELTHTIQQSNGSANSNTVLQRACSPAPCPAIGIPIPAFDPFWRHAETCINEIYSATHPGNTISFQKDYLVKAGKTPNENMALNCLRGSIRTGGSPNYTAKNGMYAGEPDIWDFTNGTMYEITTVSGAAWRNSKLGAEIVLANSLCAPADCGGLTFDRGSWVPPASCYLMDSGLYLNVVNQNGVLIYNILRDSAKELVAATAMALALAAAKNMPKSVGKKLIPGVAYAYAAAALVLLVSGKAHAGINTSGEDPLEQLYKAMAKDGTPIPPEIQAMIEQNPDLKAKMTEALKKDGNLSAAQKDINNKILQLIKDNPQDFTKEDLESLLTVSSAAKSGLPQGDLTVAEVKKMLDKKQGSPGGADGGSAKDGGATTESKDAGVPADEKPKVTDQEGDKKQVKPPLKTDPKYQKLSPESKKLIDGALPPVQELFKNFTQGTEGTLKVDEDVLKKFLEIVPSDLTDEQSQTLIGMLTSAKGKKVDEVLANLKKGVEQVRKVKDTKTPAPEGSSATKTGDGKTEEELLKDLKEKAQNMDFSKIPKGQYKINNLFKNISGTTMSAYVLFKNENNVGVLGFITAEIPGTVDVKNLKTGASFKVTITHVSPFVDKAGNITKVTLEDKITVTKD